MKLQTKLTTVLTGAFLFAMALHGESIGVNFTNGAYLMGPTDQPGIAPGANWNNAIGGSGASLALSNSSGSATTALLTWSAAGAYDHFDTPSTPNTATDLMYTGGLFGDPLLGGEVHITLQNIPYASYSVYFYASADGFIPDVLSSSDGTTTFYYEDGIGFNDSATSLLLTTSTDPGSPTVGLAEYQVFHETSPNVTLTTGGSISTEISNNVFGLQIVADTPEPGSVLLFTAGAGLIGILGRRIRKTT